MSSNAYEELKAISDAVYADQRTEWGADVIVLLAKHGIKPRTDDGRLHELVFSVASSQETTLVVGMRYQKRDGSFTEDTFIFRPGEQIGRCYRGRIEKILREYAGTHHGQPSTSAPDPKPCQG